MNSAAHVYRKAEDRARAIAELKKFDEALLEAFPGPEPMSVLLVGGACLLLQGIATQPIDSVDVIILEMLGGQERTLVFHYPTAEKFAASSEGSEDATDSKASASSSSMMILRPFYWNSASTSLLR